jgi:formylglycine-generating enzyme required for sulfatase activity
MDEEPDVTIRRALVQSLGEFNDAQLTADERQPLIEKLLVVFVFERDPGLHGAAKWLLRKWDQGAKLQELEDKLRTNESELSLIARNSFRGVGEVDKRLWYVNTQGQTMVIMDADEFLMGSPASEPDHFPNERQHRRRIGRRIAISATEVTKAQYRAFQQAVKGLDLANNPDLAELVRTDDSPQTGLTWLSEREGLPSEQGCYEPNTHGKYEEGMKAKGNYLELVGYRLPTEVEWEFACRGGTTTSRYYGLTETLLPQYAWYVANSEKHTWPVGALKPNDAGMFDMLGNAFEWCDTPFVDYPQIDADAVDDSRAGTVLSEKETRALRGGGSFLNYPLASRSAIRTGAYPSSRNFDVGFRVARTYP